MTAAFAISPLYCDSCGAEPCINPAFCAVCREADPNVGRKPSSPAEDLRSLALRARHDADRWLAGKSSKIDAVDASYNYAVALGLVYAIGDDIVQRILAAAFSSRPRAA